jgi:hypothetical protein
MLDMDGSDKAATKTAIEQCLFQKKGPFVYHLKKW